VTCAVDVQKENLAVAVFGWTWGARALLLDYWRFPGSTEQLEGDPAKPDEPSPWDQLRTVIEQREYEADDGKKYKIAFTLVDSGYLAAQVYQFCAQYRGGVYPMKGGTPAKGSLKEFGEFHTPSGRRGFLINVDYYKDRWSAALRWHWDGHGHQPEGHFNAPLDVTDDQLKELTRESKHERVDARTQRRIGWEWRRASGSRNELWDLLIYNAAAVELVAWDIFRNQLKLDAVNWQTFWDMLATRKVFYR
jgi:phage terminase large subunit GpA-like protein